jgi:hypothetical protein
MHTLKNLIFCCFTFVIILNHIAVAQVNQVTNDNSCKKFPVFVGKMGYDIAASAFSTTEKNKVGLMLLELARDTKTRAISTNQERQKVYQDATWKQFGYLSAITFDNKGNIYVLPTPFISLLQNKPWQMNRIMKVDTETGKMSVWMDLQADSTQTINNPYGLLSLTFDCTDLSIWTSSVYGSSRHSEIGTIYHIDATTKKIVDTLKNTDALSLAISTDEHNARRLYYGSARDGKIFSYLIDHNGALIRTSFRLETSLENMGIRGDDKPRKIRFVNGVMVVTGKSFNYNLEATSDKIESTYRFVWGQATNRWILQSIE